MRKQIVFIFCLVFSAGSIQTGFAQKVEVSVNRNNIVIGEQIQYGLKVQVPSAGHKVHFVIPDSIPHFDIIKKGDITTLPGNPPSLEQVITFTSFDSGSWVFPSIPVLITDGQRRIDLASSTVLVQVGYSPEDTTGIYDIRSVRKVQIDDSFWYYIALAALIALLLAWLLYRHFKKRRNRPRPVFDTVLSPLQEALSEYEKVEKDTLPDKEFHTRAAAIFKKFISRKWQTDVLNTTSGELLLQLNSKYSDASLSGRVAAPLRLSDAVKYAKFKPGDVANSNALREWKELVKMIDQSTFKI